MYLRRKIDIFLENWKTQNGRKPLIIRGARQIGKTEGVIHRTPFPTVSYHLA